MRRVNLNDICKYWGVRTLSYATHIDVIRRHNLEQMARRNPFICCISNGIPIIFFDSTRPVFAVRFHVATALGYFALGYLTERGLGKLSIQERLKADLFAARLLLRIAKINRHSKQYADRPNPWRVAQELTTFKDTYKALSTVPSHSGAEAGKRKEGQP